MDHAGLQARPHFEAVISDIAYLYQIDRLDLRLEIKQELASYGIIKESTRELREDQLKKYANRLTAFYADQETRPPQERSELDLRQILLSF